MNLDLIRAVDKWIGIPACFLLSVGHRILARFNYKGERREKRRGTPEKILFVELSEMGSSILAYPAMKYASERYPAAQLYFLVFEHNRFSVDVLGIVPAANVITISIRSPFHFISTTLGALKTIRAEAVDTVFDLELFSRFSSLLSGLSGACRRVGYARYHEEGLYRGGFITHRVFYNCHQHIAKNFMALVRAIEARKDPPLVKEVIREQDFVRPSYESSEKDLKALRERLAAVNQAVRDAKHLILFNPSAGELLPIRAWPVENYVALGKRIMEQFDAVVIVVGLKEARSEAATLVEQLGSDRCIDFTGRTSFRDLFDLMNLADVLVTADSGPAHFAALTPIRNIVLFGPETPVLYAPLGQNTCCLSSGLACSPCLSAYNHRKTSCTDPKCMKAITFEQVFEVASSCLAEPGVRN